ADARERFATGVYAIWYPLLKRTEAQALPEKLLAAGGDRWLDVRMTVRAGRDQHAGLYGSGMFIANPPHTLPTVMNAVMPSLTGLLAQDKTASFEVNFNIP
ncbi:MAG: 23S rRNA (adenine(2030)-N(6))-methyltransferase RlmJ, partial [Woeseia sp.]